MKPNILKLIHIAMFSALAALVSMFSLPVFFTPEFYKLDFSNAIVLISGFSLGPTAGVLTVFLKVLLKVIIKGSSTMGIGELASFIMGIALVLPTSIIYKKYRTFKGACVSMFVGVIFMVVFAALMNYFVLLPLYKNLLAISEDKIILLAQHINPFITDKFTFVLFAVCTFNLLEGVLICMLSLVLYKKLSRLINKSFQ